jgi:hypothetical protein
MPVFSAYFDTSGTELDPKVVTTVGVVSTAEKWVKFDRRWSGALAEYGVTQFHMKDFAHFKGEFSDWRGNDALRVSFLDRLIREAKRGVNKTFILSLMLKDYRAVDARYQLTERIGGPYAHAQLACIQMCQRWINEKKARNEILKLYVAHGDVGQEAFKRFLSTDTGDKPEFLPMIAPDGRAWTPLQLADLIAYEHRRLHETVADVGLLPHELDRRGSLVSIRRRLPAFVALCDEETLIKTCLDSGIPERAQ